MEKYKGNTELPFTFWSMLKGEQAFLKNLNLEGPSHLLSSLFDVTSFSSSTIGVANAAVAELRATRLKKREQQKIIVNSLWACAAFKGDSLFKPLGWNLPNPWDPFAGDYQCTDRWIRLHTNYSYHREAVFNVLGKCADKAELEKKVSTWKAEALESAIADVNGCSAVMYDQNEWKNHHHGKHTIKMQAIELQKSHLEANKVSDLVDSEKSLKGIRVLDMTRVFAGPVCTKFLSAHGASVLRIDPPDFHEVEGLLPETTVGKRRAFLDIKTKEGRSIFEKLIRESHVFVHGLRSDALEKLGINESYLRSLNASLVVATMNAYGFDGPWKNRRGFDSLVQMSSGIACAQAKYKNSKKPLPLPVQALDHGIGYLLAAGVCRSLTELIKSNQVYRVYGSLIGAANSLQKLPGNFDVATGPDEIFSECLIKEKTYWGEALRVASPGTIDGVGGSWDIVAGKLGSDQAQFDG